MDLNHGYLECLLNSDWSEIPHVIFGHYSLAIQLYSIQTAQQPLYLLLRQVWKRILSTHFIHWSLSSECHHYPGTRTVYFITEIMSMYFNLPECLPYSGTRTVYFIREMMSMYFSHLECLHYSGTRTVYFIVIV